MFDGETRQEFEDELDSEFESEWELELTNEYEGEESLEDVLNIGRLRGRGESEDEYQTEDEGEISSKQKHLAQQLNPILQKLAPRAAKAVEAAINSPTAGATLLDQLANQIARQVEVADEWSREWNEYEFTNEFEGVEYETPQHDALNEALATAASKVPNEAEAEAYIGALTTRIIAGKSSTMRQVIPHLIRGVAILTRLLRNSPQTISLTRMIPKIVQLTKRDLQRHAAQGKQITPRIAARVMASNTRKVLSNPIACAKTLMRPQITARQRRRRSAAMSLD